DLEIEQEFKTYFPDVTFVNIESNYRDVVKPTMSFVQKMNREAKKNNHTMTVIIPKFIPKHSWQNILHNQMSLRLRARLRWYEDIIIATYSYHLK
ncbi:amino acid permease, partial [Enterococcus faecalis]|nr:amino acid permease [Enterococcus faecalis]